MRNINRSALDHACSAEAHTALGVRASPSPSTGHCNVIQHFRRVRTQAVEGHTGRTSDSLPAEVLGLRPTAPGPVCEAGAPFATGGCVDPKLNSSALAYGMHYNLRSGTGNPLWPHQNSEC